MTRPVKWIAWRIVALVALFLFRPTMVGSGGRVCQDAFSGFVSGASAVGC